MTNRVTQNGIVVPPLPVGNSNWAEVKAGCHSSLYQIKRMRDNALATANRRVKRKNRVRGCPVWGGLARSVLAGVFFAFAVVGCSGKGEKRKDAQREKVCAPVANDQPASPPLDLPTETKRGEELLDWEARSHLRETTKVKMEEEFQKLKGEYVVISGKVMDVKVHNGKTFVSLENGRYPYHSYHGIAFYIPDSLKPTVAKWSKGEVHVMRGRVTHGWFSVPLLNVFSTQCDRGQIVVDGKVFVPKVDEEVKKLAAKREFS